MKKLLLVALLMLALVITAVACNGNETVETTAGETTAVQTPATAEPEDSTAAPETPTEAPEVPTEAPEVPTEPETTVEDTPATQAPVVTTEPETEAPDEPETPTVELTPFTEKFHANVDFINGGSKDGAGVPYQSLGTSKINGTDGVLVVLNAAENNIVVNADNTINLQGWMAVQGGINHYAYAVNGGELITAVGGADGEPLADYYAGLGMADSTKMGLFNGGNKLIADLSAYAGQTITVTFYAVPEAAQDTVAPIVSIEGLVVPAAAEEPVEDYNVPMESWTISGHQPQLITPDVAGIGPIVAAAGMEKAALIHQGSVGVGAVDLSKYSKVVIQYTTDASQPTYDLYNASGKQIYVLNAQMHMVNSPDAATVITSATFALPELNQSWKMQTIEIDLSAIDYSGDVFIAWDTLAGSFMVIASVEFIA